MPTHHTTAANLLAGLSLAALAAPTSAAAAGAVAPQVELYGAELPADRVLADPVADLLPTGPMGKGQSYAFAPPVQAIPTPTGLQVGLAGLAAVALGIAVRRRRAAVQP